MVSIIEQVQRDALDTKVPISELLRRVKFAASKLGLGSVEDWVEQELDGYKTAEQLPEYRILYGRPMARHPYRGWEALGGPVDGISVRHVVQSIASLQVLANAPDSATIHFPYTDSMLKKLNEHNGTEGWLAVLEIDRGQIVSILDRVRTMVLDWALKMEKAGVLGNEFSFDAADKGKAQGSTTTINIGSIGSFAGNLGSGNTAGDVTMSGLNLRLVTEIVDQLKAQTSALNKAGADGAQLIVRLNALETELRKPVASASIIRGLLVDLRNALAGAAGNLMATGAIAVIHQILGTGIPV